MHISIVHRNGTLTDSTREFAERRLLFALSRFAPRVDRVSVVIDDVNGPRGGVDKSCRVQVYLERLGMVTATFTDTELEPALARAADRIGRAVTRTVERNQQIDRRSLRLG